MKKYDLQNMAPRTYISHIDEFGKQVEKTPHEYPYSYDGYVLDRLLPNDEINTTLYSDRLIHQYPNFSGLKKEIMGDGGHTFYNFDNEKLELFLQKLIKNDTLKLGLIMQYCNVSSGYPLWRFDINIKNIDNGNS
jgi:hypothetical protein